MRPPSLIEEERTRAVWTEIIRFVTASLSTNVKRLRYSKLCCSVVLQMCSLGYEDFVVNTCPEIVQLTRSVFMFCMTLSAVCCILWTSETHIAQNSREPFGAEDAQC